jgi:hypothetical protein
VSGLRISGDPSRELHTPAKRAAMGNNVDRFIAVSK